MSDDTCQSCNQPTSDEYWHDCPCTCFSAPNSCPVHNAAIAAWGSIIAVVAICFMLFAALFG